MRRELETLRRADAVDPDRERPGGGDRRVLLAERARGGVARVRRDLLAQLRDPLVQLAEARERQVDLAAHLRDGGQRVAAHLQRHRRDRPQVDGHVLALDAVAARRAAREQPVLVREVDREAVDLRLDHVRDRIVGVEPLPHVLGPLEEALLVGHLLERAHGGQVLDLLEPVAQRRADALRGRFGRDQLGVLVLERLELVEEPVELGVGDLRLVEHVVEVEVVVDLLAQVVELLPDALLRARGHEPDPSRSAPRRGTGPRAEPSCRPRFGLRRRAARPAPPASARASSPRAFGPCGAGTSWR